MPVEIEVDLYSGRPNPRVTLTPAAEAALRQRLAGLPVAPAGTAGPQDGLGYRGLRIVGYAGISEIIVSAGVVELRDQAGRLALHEDPGRGLERWLIKEAVAGAVSPEVSRELQQDLAR
jgi:hypothetical protein